MVKLFSNKLFRFLPSGSNPRTVSDRKDFSRCGNAELSSAFLLSLLDPEVTITASLPATFCTFKSDETSCVPEVWPPSSLWLGWFDESKEQVRGWTGGGGPLCVGGMPDPILGLGGRVGGLGLLWGSIKLESAGLLSPSSELLKNRISKKVVGTRDPYFELNLLSYNFRYSLIILSKVSYHKKIGFKKLCCYKSKDAQQYKIHDFYNTIY